MNVILALAFISAAGILLFFYSSYSPVKRDFAKNAANMIRINALNPADQVFTDRDFRDMPPPIQRYVKYCGYIGAPKMANMKIEFHDVDFKRGRKGPSLRLDYTQYNFVKRPDRMALIDSRVYGIPFEGCDSLSAGAGGMKGVLAKCFTLFHVTGREMDQACLVTYLAESLLIPNALLRDYITVEAMDDHHVKATITYQGMTASGVFAFNDAGELTAFTTEDRSVTNDDGSMEKVKWSAVFSEYRRSAGGVKHPTKLKAIWHYPEADFTYFDGTVSRLTYDERAQITAPGQAAPR